MSTKPVRSSASSKSPEFYQGRLGQRFDDALAFAVALHRRQVRTGSNVPYVGHLLGVCALVLEEGGSEDQAIAALLHDAAEDHGVEQLGEIADRFGGAVAEIVRACSDSLLPQGARKADWRQRKEAYLKPLATATEPVLMVSLADKLFNARAITRDYKLVGEELWRRFKTGRNDPEAGRKDQLWYYKNLSEIFSSGARSLRMAQELARVVAELERLIPKRSQQASTGSRRTARNGEA